jgi:monofunctional biosynthetic peptidoglycan transglycosylase
VKNFLIKAWRITKRVLIFLLISHLIYLVLLNWVDPPITFTQFDSLISGRGLKRDYVSSSEISPNAKLAVMASEDQLFPDHNGFDWKSIEKAMAYNKKKPGRIHGASTISQQVAKNVFLWQGRSWLRKSLEIYFTFMIETLWSKERILDLYLNVSEMGDGVFGIEAASRKNFGKSAAQLNRREAAMIAASLPNPKRFTVKPLSGFVSIKYPWVMRQMSNLEADPDVQKLLK